MTDLDTIRESHQAIAVFFDGGDFSHRECRKCRQRWTSDRPCDTRVVLDALDAALDRDCDLIKRVEQDADVVFGLYRDIEADADRLAEALQEVVDAIDHKRGFRPGVLREALHQHDGPPSDLPAMTDPTTPTGKRLLASDFDTTGWGAKVVREYVTNAILAIEAEAAEQERERLRDRACAHHETHESEVLRHQFSAPWETCQARDCRLLRRILSDPEDQP